MSVPFRSEHPNYLPEQKIFVNFGNYVDFAIATLAPKRSTVVSAVEARISPKHPRLIPLRIRGASRCQASSPERRVNADPLWALSPYHLRSRRMATRTDIETSAKATARQARKLAESADKLGSSTGRIEDSADRRTVLAADRTIMAAERTYAAWVRTGLLALASGIGAKKVLAGLMPDWLITANGSVLVLFSAFCFVAAVWRQINPGPPPPAPDVPRLRPWLLIAVNGFLALVSLAALFGILTGRAGAG
jgi:putative membrane protein